MPHFVDDLIVTEIESTILYRRYTRHVYRAFGVRALALHRSSLHLFLMVQEIMYTASRGVRHNNKCRFERVGTHETEETRCEFILGCDCLTRDVILAALPQRGVATHLHKRFLPFRSPYVAAGRACH